MVQQKKQNQREDYSSYSGSYDVLSDFDESSDEEIDYSRIELLEPIHYGWEPNRNAEPFKRRFVSPQPFIFEEEIEAVEEELFDEWIDLAAEILANAGINSFKDEDFNDMIFGLESGDDRADISRSPIGLALCLAGQSVILKMKTSGKDTFISNWLFNYCEITSFSPISPIQGFDSWRKGKHDSIGFADLSRMRILVDTYAGNNPHASRKAGKVGMHGRSTVNANPEIKYLQQISQFLQCGLVLSERSSEPSYLPRELGGAGAPALFDEPANLWLAVLTMRGGTQSRVYGSATNEARKAVSDYDRHRAVHTPLLTRLGMKQEYLFGTFDEKILLQPGILRNPDLYEKVTPVIQAGAITGLQRGIISRLQSSKVLASERTAILEFGKTKRINEFVFGDKKFAEYEKAEALDRNERIRQAGGSMYANANMANLLNREATIADVTALQKVGFDTSYGGVQEFSRDHADWIFEGCKGETCTIQDLILSQDQFLMREVSSEVQMKVPGIPLTTIYQKKAVKTHYTTTKVGLWEINESVQEWANRIGEELRILRDSNYSTRGFDQIFWENREMVADDSMIIQRIRDFAGEKTNLHVVLVTDDKKLCLQTVRVTGVTVHRVRSHVFAYSVGKDYDFTPSNYEKLDKSKFSVNIARQGRQNMREPDAIYVDSGSVDAAIATMGDVELPKGVAATPRVISLSRHKDGTKTSVIYWKYQTMPKGLFAVKTAYRPDK